MLHSGSDQRFRDDNGSADPAAAAALAAYAAGQGSEHAALTALASVRLLVPLVATMVTDPGGADAARRGPLGGQGAGALGDQREKTSEIALPKLVGQDGRSAIPAFTSLETLARWQPSARPVPVAPPGVWLAAAGESCAVVVDVGGPVPLAVEGARLAALASRQPVPLPQDDPDVRDAVAVAVARSAASAGLARGGVGFRLGAAGPGEDLLIELAVPAPGGITGTAAGGSAVGRQGQVPAQGVQAAEDFAARVGSAVAAQLGGRLRRGIAIAVTPRPPRQ